MNLADWRRVVGIGCRYWCQGEWMWWGPAIVATYASDAMRAGQLNDKAFSHGHGLEDQDFWYRLMNTGMQAVRRRLWLSHVWHPIYAWAKAKPEKENQTKVKKKEFHVDFNFFRDKMCPAARVSAYCPANHHLFTHPGATVPAATLDPLMSLPGMPQGRRHSFANPLRVCPPLRTQNVFANCFTSTSTRGIQKGQKVIKTAHNINNTDPTHTTAHTVGFAEWWQAPVSVFRETIVRKNGAWWGAISPSTLMQFGLHNMVGDGLLWARLYSDAPSKCVGPLFELCPR